MFDNDIGEQRSDKYIIRTAIAVYGWDGRLKACQTLAVATGVALRMMMVLGALLLYGQVLLHANHSVRVVMMGNNGCHQHDNVDKKQQSYYDSFFPFHPAQRYKFFIFSRNPPPSFYYLLFLFQLLQRIHLFLFEEFIDTAEVFRHLLIAKLINL